MGYIQTCKADFHAYLPLVGCLSSRLPRKIIRLSTYKRGKPKRRQTDHREHSSGTTFLDQG